jgi:2,3-dihydroxybiphenyl 1,2-dioxygenase
MELLSLGYIGVNATDLPAWRDFALRILAMQVVDECCDGLGLRMDNKHHRVLISHSDTDGGAYFGFEVADEAALRAAVAELASHQVRVTIGSVNEVTLRAVTNMVYFVDPVGNRIELFHGLKDAVNGFAPPRPIGGFRTGTLGFGHVVLSCPDPARVSQFYREVLGFKLTDYFSVPFKAIFLHINPRHHSLAFIQSEKTGVHHFMVETLALDDVGHAYDFAQENAENIAVTLGRHSNDWATSFYVWTPSKFMIEYGWGGRLVDIATWQATEMTCGPSLWGHDRRWLPPHLRDLAKRLRDDAAASGLGAPLQVSSGYFALADVPSGDGKCAQVSTDTLHPNN